MHEDTLFGNPRTWVAIAFLIFFLLVGRKLWSVLTGMLDRRAANVRTELTEAQRLREEAEARLRDAERHREAAIAEAHALLEGAQVQARRLAEAATAEAAATAARRERMALDRISAAEKAAVDDVRTAAAGIASAAAERVIRETFDAGADAALIDSAIAGLPAALAPRRAA